MSSKFIERHGDSIYINGIEIMESVTGWEDADNLERQVSTHIASLHAGVQAKDERIAELEAQLAQVQAENNELRAKAYGFDIMHDLDYTHNAYEYLTSYEGRVELEADAIPWSLALYDAIEVANSTDTPTAPDSHDTQEVQSIHEDVWQVAESMHESDNE